MRGLIRLIIIISAVLRSLFFWNIKKRNPKKILIAHDLLLGDTLLLAPLMKRLNEKYPQAKKFILAKHSFIPLFKAMPYRFKALPYNSRSFLDAWNIFCKGPYDLTYVAGDNRYSWLARAVGSRWIIGIADDIPLWKNWMLDEAKPYDLKPATWADMMGRLVDNYSPKPYKKNEWPPLKTSRSLLPFNISNRRYIVCHLGASSILKYWPNEHWQSLLKHIKAKGFEVVLSVGPSEQYLIKKIDPENLCIHRETIYSLVEMWHILKNAAALVSLDTGIAHLAKLTFTPTVILFGQGSSVIHGPGDFWKELPYKYATVHPYPCRDQNLFFRRKIFWVERCVRNTNECLTPGACMEAISKDQVFKALMNLVEEK